MREHLDHANDPVHRRSDFVAHRRQKDALGAFGRLGCLAGMFQLQRALDDTALEIRIDRTNLFPGAHLLRDVDAEHGDAVRGRQHAHLKPALQSAWRNGIHFVALRRALRHAALDQREQLGRLDAGVDLHQLAPDQGLRWTSRLPCSCGIDVAATPVRVDDLAAFEEVIQRLPVPLCTLMQRLRHFLALAGVVERSRNDAFFAGDDEAEPDIRRKHRSVLATRVQAWPVPWRVAGVNARRRVIDQPLEEKQVGGG
jgi:hypothetical protein